MLRRRPLGERILVFPNAKYFFGEYRSGENLHDVISHLVV